MNRRDLAALSAERDRWQARAAEMFRAGYEAGRDSEHYTGSDLADAYTAGRRRGSQDPSAFDAGWAACEDRFADLIGGRVFPDQPPEIEARRWTRHHPDCTIAGNGRRPCKRLGCLPGPREDYGKPAPWDRGPARKAAA